MLIQLIAVSPRRHFRYHLGITPPLPDLAAIAQSGCMKLTTIRELAATFNRMLPRGHRLRLQRRLVAVTEPTLVGGRLRFSKPPTSAPPSRSWSASSTAKVRELHFHIELIDKKFHGGKWRMAGGSFAYTSDSRFPASHPFSIRNRDEK